MFIKKIDILVISETRMLKVVTRRAETDLPLCFAVPKRLVSVCLSKLKWVRFRRILRIESTIIEVIN